MALKTLRVPLDFSLEPYCFWHGHDNPFYVLCTVCDGHGDDQSEGQGGGCEFGTWSVKAEACLHPAVAALCDAWQPTDPPTGEGWQHWDIGEEYGSPVSPVFDTHEKLLEWLEKARRDFAPLGIVLSVDEL